MHNSQRKYNVEFEVFDYDKNSKNGVLLFSESIDLTIAFVDTIGVATFECSLAIGTPLRHFDTWLPIHSKSGKEHGQLHVVIMAKLKQRTTRQAETLCVG